MLFIITWCFQDIGRGLRPSLEVTAPKLRLEKVGLSYFIVFLRLSDDGLWSLLYHQIGQATGTSRFQEL